MYEGKRLSEWLEQFDVNSMGFKNNQTWLEEIAPATNAVHHIGTNALPFLVKWIDYEMPAWKVFVAEKLPDSAWRIGGIRLMRIMEGTAGRRARNALAGFEILGDKATPAVPALTGLLGKWNRRDTSRSALLALMYIGKGGLVPLIQVLTNRAAPPEFRMDAAERIAAPVMNLGTNGTLAVPFLIGCLGDSDVAGHAARVLGALRLEPNISVPALHTCLASSNVFKRIEATDALGAFGKEAIEVVPDLLVALTNRAPEEQQAASNALMHIAPEVLTNAPH